MGRLWLNNFHFEEGRHCQHAIHIIHLNWFINRFLCAIIHHFDVREKNIVNLIIIWSLNWRWNVEKKKKERDKTIKCTQKEEEKNKKREKIHWLVNFPFTVFFFLIKKTFQVLKFSLFLLQFIKLINVNCAMLILQTRHNKMFILTLFYIYLLKDRMMIAIN